MSRGSYIRDFFLIPTVVIHSGDFYTSIDIAWLKWYIGIVINKEQEHE